MWPLRFGYPVALVIVPLAVAAFVRWRRLGGACTLAAVVCLAVAIARPQWATQTRRVARLYALDASGSTFLDAPAALDAIRDSMGTLTATDQAGLLVFGASPAIALPLTDVHRLPRPLTLPPEMPPPDGTDITAAIRLAARQLAQASADRQLVLLTDGRETTGRAAAEAALAADQRIRLFCLPIGPAGIADARVVALRAPAHARLREPFQLVAELASTSAVEAELTVSRDGTPLATRRIALEPGTPRRLIATDRLDHPGYHVYTARLAIADRCDQNNSAQAVVHAEGATRLLTLATAAQPPLAALLRRVEGIDLTVAAPRNAPLDRAGLGAFDCLVLDGVPAAALEPAAQQAIRDWVRDAAGGLIAIGGPTSFGPGGYAGTPIEEALPVLCSRPKQIALLVVLDKSGSMAEESGGRPKIAFARDAVLQALKPLRATDRFGLLTFDAEPEVRIALAPVSPEQRVRDVLDAIEPHGPTELQAALERALELLAARPDAPESRHIILLSDGQAQRLDAARLRDRIRAAGVTLSVLMTGKDPKAVERLRHLAGEHFHLVADPAALPGIFRKAFLEAIHRPFVSEGRFRVAAAAAGELTRGVSPSGPLAGYIRTVLKPEAVAEWTTRKGSDPVLARWRFGLGRAIAFSSTVGTRWDAGLLGPDAVAKLWQQAVRWAARPARTPGFDAEVAEHGDTLVITVRAERDGRFANGLRLEARLAPSAGEPSTIDLPQTAPGEYRGQAPAPRRGIYRVTVTEGTAPRLSLGVARNYTREWEAFGLHRPTLDALARNGRGTVLAALRDLRNIGPATAAGYMDLDWLAVALALVLFIAGVATHTFRARRIRL